MTAFWYDADGNPVSRDRAEQLLTSDDRILAQDNIGAVMVSTVHTVLDYGLGMGGPPLIYETATFERRHGAVVGYWRTPTKHAALATHDQACAAARDNVRAS